MTQEEGAATPSLLGEAVTQELDQPLDPARIKVRQGKYRFIEGHDAVRTANRIFGFGNWGHEVVELVEIAAVEVESTPRNEREVPKPGWSVGYRCTVRLTVQARDPSGELVRCVPVSGVGYGDGIEYSGAVARHRAAELAIKEAETDAKKRALINFGDQFALSLYEKDAPEQRSEQEAARSQARVVEYAEEADVQVYLAEVAGAGFDEKHTANLLRDEDGRVRRDALERSKKAFYRERPASPAAS